MLFDRKFILKNKVSFAIILFALFFSIIHFLVKPSLVYMPDGSFREFGVGYKNKTVFPIWLVAIILAILSYTFVSCF
jgi:hypothetical protein